VAHAGRLDNRRPRPSKACARRRLTARARARTMAARRMEGRVLGRAVPGEARSQAPGVHAGDHVQGWRWGSLARRVEARILGRSLPGDSRGDARRVHGRGEVRPRALTSLAAANCASPPGTHRGPLSAHVRVTSIQAIACTNAGLPTQGGEHPRHIPESRSYIARGDLHDTRYHRRHAGVVGGRRLGRPGEGRGRYSHRYPRRGHRATILSL
jgi:hypothetical protein